MKTIPKIKIGRYEIRYIQVLYDDRYVVFSHTTKIGFRREIKISHSDEVLWKPLLNGIVDIEKIDYNGNGRYLMNLRKRIDKFLENIEKRNEYLDRD